MRMLLHEKRMLHKTAYGERTRRWQLVCCTKGRCRDGFQPTIAAELYLIYNQRHDPVNRAVATINKPVRPLVGARVGDHEGFNKL